MSDIISRQAAIDECNKRGAEHIGYAIAHLPSAQFEPCGDAVSKQYILDAFAEYIEEYKEVDEEGNHDPKWCAMKEAEMVVKEAPFAQPEIIHCRDCARCSIDVMYGDLWCDGRKVSAGHYCGYAERRTDE